MASPFDTVKAGTDALVAARRTGQPATAPDGFDAMSAEEAYAIQDGVASALGWFAPGGAMHWKSGGASRATQTHAPLPPKGVRHSPADLSDMSFAHCRVEVEVALRIGRDIAAAGVGDIDVAAAAPLVDAMCVSIEIVDTRWRDGLAAMPLAKLADLQAHGALVLGAWQEWSPHDWTRDKWARQMCTVSIGRQAVATFTGTHSLGDPVAVLPGWLAHMARRGATIARGTVVTTGSWCGMLPAGKGDRVIARFEGIGHAELVLS